jgi:glutathione S-transferase
VPTYEQDGLTLFESGAIVQYIAETYGGLLPSNAGGRARAIEWMFAALNTVEPPISDYAIATLFESDQPWSQPRLPAIIKRISERLAELSRRLGENEWLDGGFSAGDLLMIAVLRQLKGTPLDGAHENLAVYVARGEARPAFQRALAAQMAGFNAAPPPEYAFLDQPPANQGESR